MKSNLPMVFDQIAYCWDKHFDELTAKIHGEAQYTDDLPLFNDLFSLLNTSNILPSQDINLRRIHNEGRMENNFNIVINGNSYTIVCDTTAIQVGFDNIDSVLLPHLIDKTFSPLDFLTSKRSDDEGDTSSTSLITCTYVRTYCEKNAREDARLIRMIDDHLEREPVLLVLKSPSNASPISDSSLTTRLAYLILVLVRGDKN